MFVVHPTPSGAAPESPTGDLRRLETARLSLLHISTRLAYSLSDNLSAGDTSPQSQELRPQVEALVRALDWLEALENS